MQNFSNSDSNSSELTDLQTQLAKSMYYLGLTNQYPNQIMIAVGVISLLCAFFTMTTILLSKQMRKKSFINLVGVSLADMIANAWYIKLAVSRMILYNQNRPTLYLQMSCMAEDFEREFLPTLSKGFFCMCSIDRFLAVYKPYWYKSAYPKWLFPLMIFFNLLQAIFDAVLLFIGSNSNTMIVICSYTSASTAQMNTLTTTKNQIIMAIAISLYIATIVIMEYRLAKVKRERGDVKEAKRFMQIKTVWTLAIMLSAYTVTMFAGVAFYQYIIFQPAEAQYHLAPITNTLTQASSIADFCILFWRNKTFRNTFSTWFCFRRKSNQVASTSGVNVSRNQNQQKVEGNNNSEGFHQELIVQ